MLIVGETNWYRSAWAVKKFTQSKIKEIEVSWLQCKEAVGRTANERLSATRQWGETVLKGRTEEVWEWNVWDFPFLVCVPSCKEPIGQLWFTDILRCVAEWACSHSHQWSLWALSHYSGFHFSGLLSKRGLYVYGVDLKFLQLGMWIIPLLV